MLAEAEVEAGAVSDHELECMTTRGEGCLLNGNPGSAPLPRGSESVPQYGSMLCE